MSVILITLFLTFLLGKAVSPLPGDIYYSDLTTLDFSNRKMIALYETVDYSSVLNLIYSFNKLTHLENHAFSKFSSITELDLGDNLINSIADYAFSGLPNLEILYLSRNELTSINDVFFKNLSKLQVLHLQENAITSIAEDAFKNLQDLSFLYLGKNQISSVDNKIFNGLLKLTALYLHDNHLQAIPAGCFKELKTLQYLDLRVNIITEIGPNVVRDDFNYSNFKIQPSTRFQCSSRKIYQCKLNFTESNCTHDGDLVEYKGFSKENCNQNTILLTIPPISAPKNTSEYIQVNTNKSISGVVQSIDGSKSLKTPQSPEIKKVLVPKNSLETLQSSVNKNISGNNAKSTIALRPAEKENVQKVTIKTNTPELPQSSIQKNLLNENQVKRNNTNITQEPKKIGKLEIY